MIVIGLTGSIATGKTTLANWLTKLGLPVFNADQIVHDLFRQDSQVIEEIAKLWPQCVSKGQVDRACLRSQILADPHSVKTLEHITHPKVYDQEIAFIETHRDKQATAVVLDVPLLYESGQDHLCDCVIVVHCLPGKQIQRVKARGIEIGLLEHLVNLHMPLPERLSRADYSIKTDDPLEQTYENLCQILKKIEQKFKINILGDHRCAK